VQLQGLRTLFPVEPFAVAAAGGDMFRVVGLDK